MAKEQLAHSYARALFDEALENWRTSLKSLSAGIAGSGLAAKLDNPSTSFAEKEKLLQQAAPKEMSQEVRNFVHLLASKNHMHLLPEILAEFDHFAEQGPSHRVAQVTSAVALTDSEKLALEKKIRSQFGGDVGFDYSIKAEILGGVIVRVGDKVLDGSVASKFTALKEKLAS